MSKLSALHSIIKSLALTATPLVALLVGADAHAQVYSTVVAGADDTVASVDAASGLDARFYNPTSMVVDGDGNLLILEAGDGETVGGKVRKVKLSGARPVSTFAGNGSFETVDAPVLTDASFELATRMARDAATGDIYVSQPSDNSVRVIKADGTVLTLFSDDAAGAGIAVAGSVLYTTGPTKPHLRVRNLSGVVQRVVDLNGDFNFCPENGSTVSNGIAERNGIVLAACGQTVVKVDTNDEDAVTRISSFSDGPIAGLHATDNTFLVLTGSYVYELTSTGGFGSAFWTRNATATDMIFISGEPETKALITTQTAGAECESGQGVRITVGNDRSDADHYYFTTFDSTLRVIGRVLDGIIAEDEIVSSSLLCSGVDGYDGDDGSTGADGEDGISTILKQTEEPAGVNCPTGGVKLQAGLSADNVLDDEEVQTTSYVCDGIDGTNGADGSNGTDGVDGEDGAAGQNGADGTNGRDGSNGADGEGCAAADAREGGALAGLLALAFGWNRRRVSKR